MSGVFFGRVVLAACGVLARTLSETENRKRQLCSVPACPLIFLHRVDFPLRRMWLVCMVFNSSYSFYWDVEQDWDMPWVLQHGEMFCRQHGEGGRQKSLGAPMSKAHRQAYCSVSTKIAPNPALMRCALQAATEHSGVSFPCLVSRAATCTAGAGTTGCCYPTWCCASAGLTGCFGT